MDDLWSFLLVAVVLSLTPGPDDVLVLNSTLRGGPRLGAATAFGAAAGALLWGGAAAVGLAVVVSRSAAVYEVIRLAGAAYLVVLGVVPLVGQAIGWARVATTEAVGRCPLSRPAGLRPAFAAGLMSDLLNPKIGLFYVAVVPQFVPPGRPPLGYSLVLCAIDVAVALVWLLGLTWVAHAAVSWLHRPVVVRWSERCFSVCLIAIGGSVALGW
jgi:threonine/homoserine/homoserine lactone efflux protein